MARRKQEYVEAYSDGSPAYMGDQVRMTSTGEEAYLRVLGVNGYVTVYHHNWEVARVVHISEIEFVNRIPD